MDINALEPMAPEWDALGNLFGAYLHQDYDIEYGRDPWLAVSTFRVDNTARTTMSAASAARRLAEQVDGDVEGRRATDKLGLDYYPPADGYTYRGWLAALADFLETGNHPEA